MPVAALGLMPPWVAAIGMSLSSLVVVMNARRINRLNRPHCESAPSQPAGARMTSIYLLIPLSLVLVVTAVWAFFWAVNRGQFEDLDEPARSVLEDD